MSAPRTVTVTPVLPLGQPITFALLGDADYKTATQGTGGIQVVDRPKQPAATQWYDRPPMELDMTVFIDSRTIFGLSGQSVESYCALLESWLDAIPGTLQPAVLAMVGPIPGIQRNWMLYTMDAKEAIRDATAGFRSQQKYDLVFYEYQPAISSLVPNPSPANLAAQQLTAASAAISYALYTVTDGDTLASIAAAQLGNQALWTTIATLNNIRDPNSIVRGQVLIMPPAGAVPTNVITASSNASVG